MTNPIQERARELLAHVAGGGPHEWGYRCLAEGTFIADDWPFRAAELLAALEPRQQGPSREEVTLRAMLEAQMVDPYRGWNISRLNKAADDARELLGLPSVRELNPDIAKMQDHAAKHLTLFQPTFHETPASSKPAGEDCTKVEGSGQHMPSPADLAQRLVAAARGVG